MVDLGIDQMGRAEFLKLDLAEVLFRRLFALQFFNENGKWLAAEQVEEVSHGTGIGGRDLLSEFVQTCQQPTKTQEARGQGEAL
jgi:hypothetical protein